MVDKLLDDIKKTLMLPFLSMLEIFPRFVRDLARAEGKKVELTTEGGEIEVDRRVLEEMKDPLMHLVRNCIDHGIEMPEEREKIGKLPCGKNKDGRLFEGWQDRDCGFGRRGRDRRSENKIVRRESCDDIAGRCK